MSSIQSQEYQVSAEVRNGQLEQDKLELKDMIRTQSGGGLQNNIHGLNLEDIDHMASHRNREIDSHKDQIRVLKDSRISLENRWNLKKISIREIYFPERDKQVGYISSRIKADKARREEVGRSIRMSYARYDLETNIKRMRAVKKLLLEKIPKSTSQSEKVSDYS